VISNILGLFSLHGGSTEGSASFGSRAAMGMVTLIAMDKAAALLFKTKKWTFPSALAVMVGVFLTLCDLRKYNSNLADGISDALSPSVSLIKAWLPLFFVPPLVVLPLKMHLLKGMGLQLSAVVAIGSILSLTSAGLFAQMMTSLFPTAEKNAGEPKVALKSAPLPSLPPLRVPAIATAACLVASKALPYLVPSCPSAVRAVIQGTFGAAATVTGYIAGTKLPAKVKKIAHPVLICAAVTTGLLGLFAYINGLSTASVLTQYFGSGSFRGSGDIISSMLGPAIISFGIQLYQYRVMLKENALRVVTTTAFSAGFGLTSSAFLAKIFKLAPMQTALAPLTRCITTPLALAGARLTGADPSLSAFIVVITGILGASLGESVLELVGVKEPVSVGLAVGAGAHGLGAAATAYDPVKFASAVVSMTLTGLWTVALMSYTPIRQWLVKLSL
jgi:putative effector of murein hydrolase